MAYGDDEPLTDEEVGLAEVDLMRLHVHLCGSHDNKESVPVCLELRTLVRAVSVFNCQLMESELCLDLLQHVAAGLVKPDPHKPVWVGQMLADFFNRNRCHLAASGVRRAVDDSLDFEAHDV